jgi:hypothetical protein
VISLVAIADSSGPPPAAPVCSVVAGDLCAFYVPADEEPVTVASLEDREDLLETLMEGRDLLPVQFGASVQDEQSAARILVDRHDELAGALDRVRGAVELSLRVRAVEGTRAVRTNGRDYLAARLASSDAARRLHERLEAIARTATTRSGSDLLRASYLVDKGAVPAFVAEVRRAQDACPELLLLCTGPWPPFSFAGEAPSS